MVTPRQNLVHQAPIELSLKSPNVCVSCRERKQRCDKALPSCSRCVAKYIRCSYHSSDDRVAKDISVARWSSTSSSLSPDPQALCVHEQDGCIDISIYAAQELVKAASTGVCTVNKSRLVSDLQQDCDVTPAAIVSMYAAVVHRWIPVLPCEVTSGLCNLSNSNDKDEEFMLLLALLLVTRAPCKDKRHSMSSLLFQTTRQVFMLLATSTPSIAYVRAGLLIAYYACGHGLLRDAHMILAMCSTIVRMLGLSLEDREERGIAHADCLWALVLLDRAVMLASCLDPLPSAMSFAPARAKSHALLDELIDGAYKPTHGFEAAARVALVIGDALSYANSSTLAEPDLEHHLHETEHLMNKLILITTSASSSYTYCESTTLAANTFLALSARPAEVPSQGRTDIETERRRLQLESTARMVRFQCKAATAMLLTEHVDVLPVVPLCSLARAAVLAIHVCGSHMAEDEFEELRWTLQKYGERWLIGDIYLTIIDHLRSEMEAGNGNINKSLPL